MKTIQDNLPAILLIVTAMALFAIEDSLIKIVAREINVGQVLFIFSFVGFLIFAAIANQQGHRIFTRDLLNPTLVVRNVSDSAAALFFVPALTMMPLSNISAILQASPLLVTVGAAVFLKEHVGWRRWSAIFIGFIGVLIIIRPGMEGFNIASILALVGVLGLSVRDLITRKIKLEIPTIVVAASAYFFISIPAFILMLVLGGWETMSSSAFVLIVAACIIGPAGYYAITLGARIGEMSAIAPFRYTRLVFAIILGFFIFYEVPDKWMLLGSTLVVIAGIYTLLRERKMSRKLRLTQSQHAENNHAAQIAKLENK